MSIKKKFILKLKAALKEKNLFSLNKLLENHKYYLLDDGEYYLVCLGYNALGNYKKSNELILDRKDFINALNVKKLQIINLYSLNLKDEAKDKALVFFRHRYDSDLVKVLYLCSNCLEDYKSFLKIVKKSLTTSVLQLKENLSLIHFLKQNNENEILGHILLRILKKNKLDYFTIELIAENYFALKKYKLSKIYYLKLNDFKKENSNIYLNISIISNYLGQKEESIKYLRQAINFDNSNSKALEFCTEICKPNEELYPDIEQLKKIETKKKDPIEQSNINFAIAKIYEKNKLFKQAYFFFEKANLIKQKYNKFNIDTVKKEADFFLNNFSHYKISENEILKSTNNKVPIFIVGMPRSGTTLIEHILAAHSKVQHFGETNYFFKNLKFFIDIYNLDKNSKILSEYSDTDYIDYGHLYKSYFKLRKNKTHFTDKMPFNFFYLGFIKKSLPNSKIILCSRDSRDIAISIYKNNFALNVPFSNCKDSIVDYLKVYYETVKKWKDILANDIYEINYEKLIEDPENQIKIMLDFCQLGYEKDSLYFYNKNLTTDTLSTNQVNKSFYKTSIKNWEKYYNQDPLFFDSLSKLK